MANVNYMYNLLTPNKSVHFQLEDRQASLCWNNNVNMKIHLEGLLVERARSKNGKIGPFDLF